MEGRIVTTTTTYSDTQAVRSLFPAINHHQAGDLPGHMALEVAGTNKIIHGENDPPGAAVNGFARRLPVLGGDGPS